MALLANTQIGAPEGGVRVLSFSGSSAGNGARFVRRMTTVILVLKHRIGALLVLTFLLGLPAMAQDTTLERLDTWGRNRGWEGVGLLHIAGRTSCTGVMIQPDMILTAAHCLYDIDSGERVDPRQVEFRAGWRGGKAIGAYRQGGGHSCVYADGDRLSGEQIRYDVALLQLADPIPSTHGWGSRSFRA